MSFGYDDGPRAAPMHEVPCAGWPRGTRYDYHNNTCCGPYVPAPTRATRAGGGGPIAVMRGLGEEGEPMSFGTGLALGAGGGLLAAYLLFRR